MAVEAAHRKLQTELLFSRSKPFGVVDATAAKAFVDDVALVADKEFAAYLADVTRRSMIVMEGSPQVSRVLYTAAIENADEWLMLREEGRLDKTNLTIAGLMAVREWVFKNRGLKPLASATVRGGALEPLRIEQHHGRWLDTWKKGGDGIAAMDQLAAARVLFRSVAWFEAFLT